MTLTQLMTAYNDFCDVVNADMVKSLIKDTSSLTKCEAAVLALFLKATKTGGSPTARDFSTTLAALNN